MFSRFVDQSVGWLKRLKVICKQLYELNKYCYRLVVLSFGWLVSSVGAWLSFRLIGWLVSCLGDWLIGWSVMGQLVGWLIGWLAACLASWLVGSVG